MSNAVTAMKRKAENDEDMPSNKKRRSAMLTITELLSTTPPPMNEQPTGFSKLPAELVQNIASNLSVKDIVNMKAVNRQIRTFVQGCEKHLAAPIIERERARLKEESKALEFAGMPIDIAMHNMAGEFGCPWLHSYRDGQMRPEFSKAYMSANPGIWRSPTDLLRFVRRLRDVSESIVLFRVEASKEESLRVKNEIDRDSAGPIRRQAVWLRCDRAYSSGHYRGYQPIWADALRRAVSRDLPPDALEAKYSALVSLIRNEEWIPHSVTDADLQSILHRVSLRPLGCLQMQSFGPPPARGIRALNIRAIDNVSSSLCKNPTQNVLPKTYPMPFDTWLRFDNDKIPDILGCGVLRPGRDELDEMKKKEGASWHLVWREKEPLPELQQYVDHTAVYQTVASDLEMAALLQSAKVGFDFKYWKEA